MGDRNKGLSHRTSPLGAATATPALESGHRRRPSAITTTANNLGLHNAVSRGDIGSICYALLGGQPIDSVMFGLQPIHVAACQDDPTILDFLLRNGADINAQTTLRTPRHRRSPTYQRQPQPQPQPPQPLPQTPQHGRRPSIQLWPQHQRGLRSRGSISFLKEFGASAISRPINFTTGLHSMNPPNDESDDQFTGPTSQPGQQGAPSAASTDADWYYGATPLHFAVANRHMSIIEHLVRNGALLDVPDSYGNTSEAIALARGDDDVARLLQLERKRKHVDLFGNVSVNVNGPSISAPGSQQPQLHQPQLQQRQGTNDTSNGSPPFMLSMHHGFIRDIVVSTAIQDRSTLQFPSPDPSVSCFSESSPTSVKSPAYPATATITPPPSARQPRKPEFASAVPVRRHTAGDAEPHAGYARTPHGSSRLKIKRRGTSPIGLRPLSLTHTQYYSSQHGGW